MRTNDSRLEPLARFALMAFVAGLHACVSWWLLFRYTVPLPRPGGDAPVTFVHFIPRSEPFAPASSTPVIPAAPARRETSDPRGPAAGDVAPEAGTTASFIPPAPPGAARPLQLSLPEAQVPIVFAARDPLASSVEIAPRGTRFEQAWATDGDAVEKLKEDSLVARTLLGLFGGRDTCTDKAIRERRKDCVGADYQPGIHEAIQGH